MLKKIVLRIINFLRREGIKNELKLIREEIDTLKRFVVLKECCPEVLKILEVNTKFDISMNGLNWKNNELRLQFPYNLLSNIFYYEIVMLKIRELTPVNLRKKEMMYEILSYIKCVQKEKVADCYFKLLHAVRETFMLFDEVPKKIFENMDSDVNADYSCRYNHLFSISYSLLIRDFENATRKLNKYIKYCGLENIHTFIPVAYFAYKNGYKNKDILKAAYMFENLKSTSDNNIFLKRIKSKSVAVVGNGPSELNTNNGIVIDSYEEVVRFNEFAQFIKPLSKDYGEKVTMCAETNDYPDKFISDTEFRILRRNCYIQDISNYDDYNKLMNDKHIFYSVEDDVYKEIYNKYGIISPTTGFLLLYIIKKIKQDDFTLKDIYGFSFKECKDDGATHYDGERVLNGHDMASEISVLRDMFK